MVKEAKIDYDEENDVLYVYSGEKVKDSLEIDNFVLDFSADNKVVGVEIFDASSFLSKLNNLEVKKENLSNIIRARMQFYQSKELFFVLIFIAYNLEGKEREISVQVPAPTPVLVEP